MKRIIAIVALAAFAFSVTAGSNCCPSKEAAKEECPSKAKQECPSKAGKCPAGGEQKKDEKKS